MECSDNGYHYNAGDVERLQDIRDPGLRRVMCAPQMTTPAMQCSQDVASSLHTDNAPPAPQRMLPSQAQALCHIC